VDDTLYVQTRSPGSEDTWVTVVAVRKNDVPLARAVESILAAELASQPVPVRVYAAADLHTLGGSDAVARAEQQADTDFARELQARAVDSLDRHHIDPD
jgi:hypothetical protein